MSCSNCCFLTHIQVSQETGKAVWHSHLFQNFPQFVVIHIVKGFSIVNEPEVGVFLEFPCFLYDPMNVGNLISGSSAFSKPSLYLWKFSVHILFKTSLRDFEHSLASMWNEHKYTVVWTSLAFPFFGIGMKTDLFQWEPPKVTSHVSQSQKSGGNNISKRISLSTMSTLVTKFFTQNFFQCKRCCPCLETVCHFQLCENHLWCLQPGPVLRLRPESWGRGPTHEDGPAMPRAMHPGCRM